MKNKDQWESLLSSAIMRERLISASMYITAFELLKDAIVERIKNFYCIGFDEKGLSISPEPAAIVEDYR